MAALGTPPVPLVKVNNAAVSCTAGSIIGRGSSRSFVAHGLAAGHQPRVEMRIGTKRSDGIAKLSACATVAPIKARGGLSLQQRSMCARPAVGSTTITTAPKRNTAASVTYNPMPIGTSTITASPGLTPRPSSSVASFAPSRSRLTKEILEPSRSMIAVLSGSFSTGSSNFSSRFIAFVNTARNVA